MGAMHCALTGGEQRTGALSGGRSLGCYAAEHRPCALCGDTTWVAALRSTVRVLSRGTPWAASLGRVFAARSTTLQVSAHGKYRCGAAAIRLARIAFFCLSGCVAQPLIRVDVVPLPVVPEFRPEYFG